MTLFTYGIAFLCLEGAVVVDYAYGEDLEFFVDESGVRNLESMVEELLEFR